MPPRIRKPARMRRSQYKRLPQSAYVPLRITAWLQCGVISDPALPLDGLIYALLHRRQFGEQTATAPGEAIENGNSGVTMPFARVNEHGPDWYYAASWAQWNGAVAEGHDHWNKRLDLGLSDLIDFGPRKARFEFASGRYKSYHMPVFYRHAISVDWYVRGLKDELENLLRFATHLGKKTSQGFGSVLRWQVEEIEDDWSVRNAAGELVRAIPGERGVLIGFRPSYWLPKNQALCEVPR